MSTPTTSMHDTQKASNTDAAIIIDHLVKSYGAVHAVKGISLEVQRGEIFGFLGPKGAGKTTVHKALFMTFDALWHPAFVLKQGAINQACRCAV